MANLLVNGYIFKTVFFSARHIYAGTQQGTPHLTSLAPLPATCRVKRDNGELEKILNLLLFVYFFGKSAETLNK